jgi:hypothetical protein
MISRLTTFAAIFAIVTTASLAFAASVSQHRAAPATEVIVLERVVVNGTHTPSN